MSIKIQRYIEVGKKVIPIPPICKDENTGKQCANNGKVCKCHVYAGDMSFKNNFQANE